jgi:hypothetical protein
LVQDFLAGLLTVAQQALRVATALAAAALLATSASAKPTSPQRSWAPHLGAAVAYATHRRGDIAFAVRTRSCFWGWRQSVSFRSASVVKAMLLVAYLNEPWVRQRDLRRDELRLLGPMILWSDNDAAGRVFEIVGTDGLELVAYRSSMRHFTPVEGAWSVSGITAADQTRFFLRIERLFPRRHRRYGLHLLESIIPGQRWGIAAARPNGWTMYFKGGWTEDPRWIDHQVALLTHRGHAVSIAILTQGSGSHAYGRETLRGIAARLLRGLR